MTDSKYIYNSHNVSNLVYYFVCPTKYRRVVITDDVDNSMKQSIIAKRMFAEHPEIKKQLWGGQFWSDGYFVASVGKDRSEKAVSNYVRNQGK